MDKKMRKEEDWGLTRFHSLLRVVSLSLSLPLATPPTRTRVPVVVLEHGQRVRRDDWTIERGGRSKVVRRARFRRFRHGERGALEGGEGRVKDVD